MFQAAQTYSAQVTGTVVNVDAASSVRLHSLVLVNTTAALAYLQIFYLPAASVTLGTTVPHDVIPLLANGGVSISTGWRGKGLALSWAGTTARGNTTGAAIDVFLTYGG